MGKRSGGGRIIVTFYDLCQDIRAGSPATTSLSCGFNSSMFSVDSTVRVEEEKAEEVSASSGNENDEVKIQQSNDRRAHISKYLKDKKAKRLFKIQSSKAQSIDLAKEELSSKRRLIERMDAANNKFREQMETLGHLISQCLGLMAAMMNPAQVTFATQHQDIRNNNAQQEEIDKFLEHAFSTQN